MAAKGDGRSFRKKANGDVAFLQRIAGGSRRRRRCLRRREGYWVFAAFSLSGTVFSAGCCRE